MSHEIHIVAFDVPYPADYGGVIDIYNRLLWFKSKGWEITLHCFEYGREKNNELEKIATVFYYPRKKSFWSWLSLTPFIVETRKNKLLAKRLAEADCPVILEGLHSAHYCKITPGKFWVRTHNIEHEYYRELSKKASFLKKNYFLSESIKLKFYERRLKLAKGLLTLSQTDFLHFKKINSNCHLVYPNIEILLDEASTEIFVLVQGNFSVEENHSSALWLTKNIVAECKEIEFVFAGKNPKQELINAVTNAEGRMWKNPTDKEMKLLNRKARIHLLHTHQATGLKLKLINALNSKGHVVANDTMFIGTELKQFCLLANGAKEYVAIIREKIASELKTEDLNIRRVYLQDVFGGNQLDKIVEVL
ncbi:MAG: hypothetical protein ACI9G9_000187 [Psychromonas sp.]|jgi:hypothetical protein